MRMTGLMLMLLFCSSIERGVAQDFAEGTYISTLRGMVPIDSIQVGDLIENGIDSPGPQYDAPFFNRVTKIDRETGRTITVRTDFEKIVLSPNTFLKSIKGEWIQAKSLSAGTKLIGKKGPISVTEIDHSESTTNLYSLTLDRYHSSYLVDHVTTLDTPGQKLLKKPKRKNPSSQIDHKHGSLFRRWLMFSTIAPL